jgi:hypothetical protein
VLQEYPEFAFFKILQGATKGFAKMNEVRQLAIMDPKLSDDEKRQRIRMVEQQETDVARRINEVFNRYMQSRKSAKLKDAFAVPVSSAPVGRPQ